ncbi:ribonuclease III [uncultured Sphingomonas sp.]|uniref:ribonuclease III n=1 Tax=uncultured Sphingomonas sp. TaxID=158754 RepID=UPI0025D416F2|nr:ribonuclease III [uncultured Sphingomonas sp.]
MAAAVDVVLGRAVAPDRGRLLSDALHDWVGQALGRAPTRIDDYARALTHGSTARATYERLEFLGDRVLGLAVAEWLYERFPSESEGALSKRFNALVTGAVCAEIARGIGVVPHLKLGKQARDDGAGDSDNVLGDVMEALIGAYYLDHGHDAARALVRTLWGSRIDAQLRVPRHPKSALQEWAAANNRRPPEYAIVDKSGPGHAPRFTVRVTIGKLAAAEATGTSKQEAETLAAKTLLAQLGG